MSCDRQIRQDGHSSRSADRSASASIRTPIELKIGASVVVRWWPVDLPVPDGWVDAMARPGHHMRWSRLIMEAK